MVLEPNWNEQVEVARRQVSVGAEFQKGRRLRLRSWCRAGERQGQWPNPQCVSCSSALSPHLSTAHAVQGQGAEALKSSFFPLPHPTPFLKKVCFLRLCVCFLALSTLAGLKVEAG